jgi:hypothetical protein
MQPVMMNAAMVDCKGLRNTLNILADDAPPFVSLSDIGSFMILFFAKAGNLPSSGI